MLSPAEYERWFLDAPFDASEGEDARARYIANAVGREPPCLSPVKHQPARDQVLYGWFLPHSQRWDDITHIASRFVRFREWSLVDEIRDRREFCDTHPVPDAHRSHRTTMYTIGMALGCVLRSCEFTPPRDINWPAFQLAMSYTPVDALRELTSPVWISCLYGHMYRSRGNEDMLLAHYAIRAYVTSGPRLAQSGFVRWANERTRLGPDVAFLIASFCVPDRILREFPPLTHRAAATQSK